MLSQCLLRPPTIQRGTSSDEDGEESDLDLVAMSGEDDAFDRESALDTSSSEGGDSEDSDHESEEEEESEDAKKRRTTITMLNVCFL